MEHLQDYIATAQAVAEENRQRELVKLSDEYRQLELEHQQIADKKAQLLQGIPDSSEELALCEKALKEEMMKNGVFEAEGVEVKTRTSKKVDVQILLEKLDGDFDAWRAIIETSPPSQKSITDFVKANPAWKNAKYAIVEDKTTIASISLPSES